MKLTDEQCEKNDSISTDQIKMDLAETKAEIEQIELELEALYKDRVNNRLPIYMREGKLPARKEFVESLECILEYRERLGS